MDRRTGSYPSSSGDRLTLLRGVSAVAMMCGLALPAQAQLAQMRAGAGTPVTVVVPNAAAAVRPANMRQALERAGMVRDRATQLRSYVISARDAAVTATRTQPTDGLSDHGLSPIAKIREAMALQNGGNQAGANEILIQTSVARDTTGVATWHGAALPTQVTADGKTTVTITQTESRALLSWDRFDVGKNTTLQFDQKLQGVAQPGWTVVNRVVNTTAPSTILGRIKADGTVLVLNQRGVIFGESAQVNLNSLLVSTLELGNYGRNFRTVNLPNGTTTAFDALSLAERNANYVQNGLFILNSAAPLTAPPYLLSPLYAPGTGRTDTTPAIEGTITVDAGASISAGNGGFIILAGPEVQSAGILKTTEGQVSLQGGRFITAVRSTGDSNGVDPFVRGLILRTAQAGRSNASQPLVTSADDGIVINRGLIDSARGYISLGAGLFGEVTNGGLLSSTTSVSRNGKISLTAGRVTLTGSTATTPGGGIAIEPDANGETIPQGTAAEPPSFKTSQVEIGARADAATDVTDPFGMLIPSVVTLGQDSLILAPSGDVVIGRAAGVAYDPLLNLRNRSSIDIRAGATIDVSGIKDLHVDIARNTLTITPVKRNELRDTPTYRETNTTGDFTLNGKTLTIDIRRSGVRSDGVAWVGSPLIEGGSLASQIPLTAAELMTTGGNVALGVNLVNGAGSAADAPFVRIARAATIDFSGGWIHYDSGIVRTSKLVTADGRLVDIGDADPNEIYVAVADGFTEAQPRFGIIQTHNSAVADAGRFEQGYDEGRDAGSLTIGASASRVDAALYGNAFAGARQIADADAPSLAAGGTDPRTLQRAPSELPAGGLLRIGSFTGTAGVAPGGDIIVYHGTRGNTPSDLGQTLLNDAMLSDAGLSALTLQTSGQVIFAGADQALLQPEGVVTLTGASDVKLAAGGVLTVDAGRTIRFDGTVTAPSGRIVARTYELAGAPILLGGFTAIGNPFRTDDDIRSLYASANDAPSGQFDIVVNGTLSTAGLWTNALLAPDQVGGKAWLDGGSISLTVAPKVFVPIGTSFPAAESAVDLSGSILINGGALLNVSAGGYAGVDRSLLLTGMGGDVSLINETTYASIIRTAVPTPDNPDGQSNNPVAGTNQSVDFTPGGDVTPALVPNPNGTRAEVRIAEGTIKGFGFSGGGTFTLVSPDIRFSSSNSQPGTRIPLNFLAETGFGTLDLTSYRSRIVRDVFTNDRSGNSAFFETTSLVVGAGRTLDLTQTLMPSFLDADRVALLLGKESGTDITILAALKPAIPTAEWDRRAANLKLGGLMELVVEQGGKITGAAGATITTPKLVNAGTITLHGGSIVQRAVLPDVLANLGLGVRSLDAAFGGGTDANGRFDEDAANAAGITDPGASGTLLTNRELVTREGAERFIYFLGEAGATEGIRLEAGSVTDLSGVAVFDPRAPILPSGRQLVLGKLYAGGTIATSAAFQTTATDTTQSLFSNPVYGSPRYLDTIQANDPPLVGVVAGYAFNALAGSTIDISGASTQFDQPVSATDYARRPQWSNGGTLSVMAGGTVAGSRIDASGGAAKALGGTLEWLRPVLRQNDNGQAADGVLFANKIEQAGFDSFIARGGITFDGNVSLSLDKYFAVLSAPAITDNQVGTDAAVSISATQGSDAHVSASYVRLASRLGRIANGSFLGGSGDAEVTIAAGKSGMDVVGAILFDSSITATTLLSAGDIRLNGVDDRAANSTALPVLNGELIAQGDLTFDAGRVYATTGTGNLQQLVEDRRAGRTSAATPFLIAATGDSTIRFAGSHIDKTAPLSAGSWLKVQASTIEQDGYLAAPLGLLEIGSNDVIGITGSGRFVPATESVTFGAGSITTVSGDGLKVPYGTTTDLAEYFFSPSVNLPVTAPPVGELRVAGGTIDVGTGAKVDLSGGGDVFAFEFVSGTGGSRDVLDRFNGDRFSSNDYDPVTGIGYQFSDRRQVFAIVPKAKAQTQSIADFDPIYSADYGAAGPVDLYGLQAGLTITLDGSTGLPAGEYLVLPAHYALLPGAYRIVENVGAAVPIKGSPQTLVDGTTIVGGTFSYADGDFAESQRRSFTVQSATTFLKYSRIEVTGGSKSLTDRATAQNQVAPRLPIDAARAVLSPLEVLRVAGTFDTTVAAGGRGAQIDIASTNIVIGAESVGDVEGSVLLTNGSLSKLKANSLLIGGERTDNADGTTTLNVTANTILIKDNANLKAAELLFAVGGGKAFEQNGDTPSLVVENFATLTATGTLDDSLTGDYVVPGSGTSTRFDRTGIGAVLRLANGAERLVARTGENVALNSSRQSRLRIGFADLHGTNLALDTTGSLSIVARAVLDVKNIALSGDVIRFGGSFIQPQLEAQLAAAERLTLRSSDAIGFSAGVHTFNNLVIDSGGIAQVIPPTTPDARGDVVINAGSVTLGNSGKDLGGCAGFGVRACTSGGSTLTLNATDLTLRSGALHTYGFDGAVALSAVQGMYVEGKGGLDTGPAALSLATPFIADRAVAADPREQTVQPDYQFATSSTISLATPPLATGATLPTPTGNRAPGARIAFGTIDRPVESISITGTKILATAGIIDIRADGDVTLAGNAALSTPGYSRTFGDEVDSTTVSAGAGTINLVSLNGDIVLPATSTLAVDSYDGPDAKGRLDQNDGKAGTINLIASRGAITFAATLNPGVTGARSASLTFDSGKSAFDLAGFVSQYGTRFQGDIHVRAGMGNLTLNGGQTLRATSVSLASEAGSISIAGTIDTSGVKVAGMTAANAAAARVDGGDIALYGQNGVALTATGRLDTHTTGYADNDTRTASAGDVRIGIGAQNAAITIDADAVIDVGARRTQAAIAGGKTGDRLVAQTVKDPVTLADRTVYRLATADAGGVVSLRAPVIGDGGDRVDIRLPDRTSIVGAKSIEVEGFRRYDLDALAATGLYDGIITSGAITYLDLATGVDSGYEFNILAGNFVTEDGLPSVVNFIRNFDISAVDGSDLDGMRLRPGVELVSKNNIEFLSNWNLGAGTVDQEAALAAGVLVAVPQLNGGVRVDVDANSNNLPYVAVAPGREAELFENYVEMYYRVGGRVDGEAPVLTLRAAKNIRSEYSITDGFFLFQDRTDPFYMSYQLGGGDRQVLPAATFTCASLASGDCENTIDFLSYAQNFGSVDATAGALINLTRIIAGADAIPSAAAPYNARANSPAALGALNIDEEEVGDPLGSASLFPLINGGTASVKSTSFRLVGGAGESLSVDPLHVDRATGGNVLIAGEHSYAVKATRGENNQYVTAGGFNPLTGEYSGAYQFQLRVTPEVATSETEYLYAPADANFIDTVINSGSSANLGAVEQPTEIFTVVSWGGTTDQAEFLRQKAAEFFNLIDPTSYDFTRYERMTPAQRDGLRLGVSQGNRNTPSGVAARLSDVLAFLAAVGPDLAKNVVTGNFPANPPVTEAPINFGGGNTAYYGSVVRTGDGTIDIAAANDVKLVRSDAVVYRNDRNRNGTVDEPGRQVGGTAVYTAGHLAVRTPILASATIGNVNATLTWGDQAIAPAIDDSGYLPSPKGQFFSEPVLLEGGGTVAIIAGGDVIGRRDAWAESFLATPATFDRSTLGREGNAFDLTFDTFQGLAPIDRNRIGASDQIWRTGAIGQDSVIGIVPQLFTSGVAALGGGDVVIRADGSVFDLTVALDDSIVTANPITGTAGAPASTRITATGANGAPIQLSLGYGNLSLTAGQDLIGGQIDIASGAAQIVVGGSVSGGGLVDKPAPQGADPNELRLRVSDAAIAMTVRGSVTMAGVSALGASGSDQPNAAYASAGNFSAISALDLVAGGAVTITGSRKDQAVAFDINKEASTAGFVLPASLGLVSLTDDIVLPDSVPYLLYPSLLGQLRLLAGGDIAQISLAMSDSDPSLLPGAFSAFVGNVTSGLFGPGLNYTQGLAFGFPAALPTTSDATLRLYHNERPTHADDAEPVRIFAGGSISSAVITLPKQARIGAGVDLVDVYFTGQNVNASDVTRITAGRDIIATTGSSLVGGRNLPFLVSNSFTLGGPGTLFVEAGRNLGPFINSATIGGVSYAGGIRTVGNDLNPWLAPQGASVFALFGVGNGVDYDALRETYLNPANATKLDGDLFEQDADLSGNLSPDRTRPIYAPILALWLRDNEPELFAQLFPGQTFPDTDAGKAALATAAYGKFQALYDSFATLGTLRQRAFLINDLYFNELAQPSIPTSPSFQQFIRGYRAVQTLFPTRLGYTDNLATYTTDPGTVNPDHPLGVPTKNVVDGEPQRATRVVTGNVDLRLATIGSTRGGDVTILGPGGDFIAGSVVRTSEQAARRASRLGFTDLRSLEYGNIGSLNTRLIQSIPLGFEGVLTLRGGQVRSFTDGDFRLNQSRLFTLGGGNVTMWSSNGDLNAGQGPKSASNFPPVTIRFDQNGLAEVNSIGSVAGAGIGAFKRTPTDADASVILIAPVGEVDAGDAGVRASGNVFVAAARVANADNFKAGGDVSGVPGATVAPAPAVPTSAASSIAAQAAGLGQNNGNADRRSVITVDVLGFSGNNPCDDPNNTDPTCER